MMDHERQLKALPTKLVISQFSSFQPPTLLANQSSINRDLWQGTDDGKHCQSSVVDLSGEALQFLLLVLPLRHLPRGQLKTQIHSAQVCLTNAPKPVA